MHDTWTVLPWSNRAFVPSKDSHVSAVWNSGHHRMREQWYSLVMWTLGIKFRVTSKVPYAEEVPVNWQHCTWMTRRGKMLISRNWSVWKARLPNPSAPFRSLPMPRFGSLSLLLARVGCGIAWGVRRVPLHIAPDLVEKYLLCSFCIKKIFCVSK